MAEIRALVDKQILESYQSLTAAYNAHIDNLQQDYNSILEAQFRDQLELQKLRREYEDLRTQQPPRGHRTTDADAELIRKLRDELNAVREELAQALPPHERAQLEATLAAETSRATSSEAVAKIAEDEASELRQKMQQAMKHLTRALGLWEDHPDKAEHAFEAVIDLLTSTGDEDNG